jgi:hypothetical protein
MRFQSIYWVARQVVCAAAQDAPMPKADRKSAAGCEKTHPAVSVQGKPHASTGIFHHDDAESGQ